MRERLPIIFSIVALVVAVFGSTGLGRAAVDKVVPLAKRSFTADTAKNALQVNRIKASRSPTPGMLLALDAQGKFPASVLAGTTGAGPAGPAGPTGPAGPAGAKGDTGAPGLAGVELVTASSANNTATGLKTATVSCPTGKKVVGGGAEIQSSPIYPITVNKATADLSAWTASGYKETASGAFWGVVVYAICVTVN